MSIFSRLIILPIRVYVFFTVRNTDPPILQRFSTINSRWRLARSQLAYIICIMQESSCPETTSSFIIRTVDEIGKGKRKYHKLKPPGEQCSQIVQLRDEKSPLNIILCTHPTKRFCTAFKRGIRERRNHINFGGNLIIAITRSFVQVHFCHGLFASRDFRSGL